jgi:hypothetical protein
MLSLDRRSLLATARSTGWDLEGHVRRVYDTFGFRAGKPPRLFRRPGETRPAIQQSLMDWNADLGARDRMDWSGFLARHQRILRPIARLPRLGKLDDAGIDRVCEVVGELEAFKKTDGRTLVFGSKAAHFHFPWLVPVMSSEVADGLREVERAHGEDVRRHIPGEGRRFGFTSADARRTAYRNYVQLGNAIMRDVDTRRLLRGVTDARYDLHAKGHRLQALKLNLPRVPAVEHLLQERRREFLVGLARQLELDPEPALDVRDVVLDVLAQRLMLGAEGQALHLQEDLLRRPVEHVSVPYDFDAHLNSLQSPLLIMG